MKETTLDKKGEIACKDIIINLKDLEKKGELTPEVKGVLMGAVMTVRAMRSEEGKEECLKTKQNI